jgi:predicted MFS family arabinose efflux permease
MVDVASFVVVSVHLFSVSGPEAVAAFVVARTVGPAVGTPFVLVFGGRWPPGRTLAVCAAVAAAASAATALVIGAGGPVAAIVVLGGVVGVALSCLRPLVVSVLPGHIVGPSQLLATNSAAALLDNLSTLTGPTLAGAALATAGPEAALWVCAGVLAATAAWVRDVRDPGAVHQLAPGAPAAVGRVVLDGMRVLGGSGPLRLVTLLTAAQTFVRGALNVLVVGLAIDLLDMGDGGVGVLLGAIGVGGLVGLPVAIRLAHGGGLGRGLAIALVLWGTPLALAADAPGAGVAIGLFLVVGIGNHLVDLTTDTLMQRLVKRSQLPAALGAFEAVLYAGMAVGALVAERLLALFGLRTALVVVGLILPGLALASWRMLAGIDRQVSTRDGDARLLQFHGIFSPLVMSTIDHLAATMGREEYGAGETIIRKGDFGDRYLVIESGTVEIVDDGTLLAVLGPHEGFGELALLDDAPRNATAIARSAVCVRTLRREDFLAAVRSHGQVHEAVHTAAAERRRETPATQRPTVR